ncbi:MAG: flagellar export protein FliJ [Chlorobiaceae bacterium]|nr:flagellar export protein FliJ [Chlorobiaceae bacterium]
MFKFKYQSIEDIKKIFEEKAKKELSLTEKKIDQANDDKIKLLQEKDDVSSNIINGTYKSSVLRNYQLYKDYLSSMIVRKEEELQELENIKEEQRKLLLQNSKEHKIFTSLRETHLSEFNIEENRKELKQTDEYATIKFTRTT